MIGESTTSVKKTVSDHDVHILYLDDYHAADPLFLQSLARSLSRVDRVRFVLVHGSGEHAQQALELEGKVRVRSHGVLPVQTQEEHALVERALREINRRITGILTDAVVASVGVMGSERGLLAVDGTQLRIMRIGWLESLMDQGVVPVVASHASERGTDRTGEVGIHQTVAALVGASSHPATVVAFTKTNLPGVMLGREPEEEIPIERVNAQWVVDLPQLSDLASRDVRVLLTNTARLSDSGGPTGTLIRPST